jgi:type IV pilus assembly protein PilF
MFGCVSNQPSKDDQQEQALKAAETNTALGLEYMNRGQPEVALGKLKKAIAEDDEYAPAHTVLAVLYETIGEYQLAGKHYRKAVDLDPNNGDINNNYGVYLCQSDKVREAQRFFVKALEDPFYRTPAVALTNAGSCALGAGMLADTDGYLRRALQFSPQFPDALLLMAKLNETEKNYLTSRAFIQRFEAVTEATAESLFLGYRIETALGDDNARMRYFEVLNGQFPGAPETAEVRRQLER